jgi:hypothetical protein
VYGVTALADVIACTFAASTSPSASLLVVEQDQESVLIPSESIWSSEAASTQVVRTAPAEAAVKSLER